MKNTNTSSVCSKDGITRDYRDMVFQFREDGYFNMTKAAQHFGKDLSNFMRSPDTIDYLDALSNSADSQNKTPVVSKAGRYGGTWGHPKLAVFFAQWLDGKFAIWYAPVLADLLRGKAEVTITKPEESAVLAHSAKAMGCPIGLQKLPSFERSTNMKNTNTSSACSQDVITRDYQGMTFQFREGGYFNMTVAAQTYGKQLNNFWLSPATKEYMDALQETLDSNVSLIEAKRGVGTWAHPKLAVFFARWLDVKFAVWCDMMIDDLLRGKAEVTITKPEESAVLALPKDYASALRALLASVEEQEKLQAKTVEQDKKIYHLNTLMTVNNFLTQHGYQVIQTNKLKLTYKAKFLTTERGFPLERDREYTFLDQQGHQRTYQPYLFREDVLKDAAKILGLR